MKSVLLGNGINIQFGGKAYSNRFIMARILFNARTGKYEKLFDNKVTGEDIEFLFKEFLNIANNTLLNKYDNFEGVLNTGIQDFKKRFAYRNSFKKYYEIPLEDWFLLMAIAFEENPDIKELFDPSKKGLERMILDAIYNVGEIQNLYCNMGKKVKRFLKSFDNIFTLNYDNNIEKKIKRDVYHLHGDFSVLADYENHDTVLGFMRSKSKPSTITSENKHCFCNALLDFSGEMKYVKALENKNLIQEINKFRIMNQNNKNDFQNIICQIEKNNPSEKDIINTAVNNPNLMMATDYHFSDLESLEGELSIIGLSPQNDSHIFHCIDKSSVERVVFYYHRDEPDSLPLYKKYKLEKAETLWTSLDANKPHYNYEVSIPDTKEVNDFLKMLNTISFDEISRKEIEEQLKEYPPFRRDPLCREAIELMKNQKKEVIKDESEMECQFMEISRIALREGVFPSAFYLMLLNYLKDSPKA